MLSKIESLGIDSREVAKMIGKNHNHLTRDIKNYITVLSANPKLDSLNFFKESEYIDAQGKPRPCYLITKKGCELVAHKITGEKGVLFTATYIERFHSMEEQLLTPQLPKSFSEALRMLADETEKSESLLLENKQKDQIIGELKPKADYMDLILNSKSLVTITQIAKDYGMSGTAMNKLLHDNKVQFCQNGQWLLYSKYQHSGYTHSETVSFKHKNGKSAVKMNTKWTQKGRVFLYNLLKEMDILPMIESEFNDITDSEQIA